MVSKIQRKEYDKIQESRKHSRSGINAGFLVWKGADGKYYKTDKSGIAGTKEMVEFNKQLKAGLDNVQLIL
jgi:hypothetical protein